MQSEVNRLLDSNPAVVLTGPRQVGKTTLAHALAPERGALYLDLERPSDLAKLSDVEQYCDQTSGKLLILDEIHRIPALFAPLRGIIDERRRAGRRTGHFLLLGSASIDLLKQSSETLAGRIAHCELCPFNASEIPERDQLRLWSRGGFPESYLAHTDALSFEWRLNFIGTYLERDIPQFGPRIPAETLRRFWTMLAHNQAQPHNASALARGLDVRGVTIARYLDLMVDLLLVRRLPSWTSNIGRRMIRAPKIYIRDSGICHALLGIATADQLFGHPVVGSSWEGFVIENILTALPRRAAAGFYRTSGGAEVDLVIDMGAGALWAVEIKRSSTPRISRGFRSACDDLRPARSFVVHGGRESYPLDRHVHAVTLHDMVERLGLASIGQA